MPSPAARLLLPRRPFIRESVRSATTHRSQTNEPSSRVRMTVPRAVLAVALRVTSVAVVTGRLATSERPDEEEHRGSEQHHEHRGEDEEHEREEDLDRRLLCPFLC